MGRELPYMPWWTRDYRNDEKVQLMSDSQDLVYRRLLDWSWEIGPLPSDPVQLAKLARMTITKFKRAWKAPLTECWETRSDGKIFNYRCEMERKSAYKRSEKARHAAQKRADRRRNSQKIKEEENLEHATSTATGSAQPLLDGYESPRDHTHIHNSDLTKQDLSDPVHLAAKLEGAHAPNGAPPEPVYWDNKKHEPVVDLHWLWDNLKDYMAECGTTLDKTDVAAEMELLRSKLLGNERLWAVRARKSDGLPSSESKFKQMQSYVLSHFRLGVQAKQRRTRNKAPNKLQRTMERIRDGLGRID